MHWMIALHLYIDDRIHLYIQHNIVINVLCLNNSCVEHYTCLLLMLWAAKLNWLAELRVKQSSPSFRVGIPSRGFYLFFFLVVGQNPQPTTFGWMEHNVICIMYSSLQISHLRYLSLINCSLPSSHIWITAYCSSKQGDLLACTVAPTCINWSSTSMLHLSSSHTISYEYSKLECSPPAVTGTVPRSLI